MLFTACISLEEKDLEQKELALEAPLTNLLKWFKGAKTK